MQTIQIKRTLTPDQAPSGLVPGELAVEMNSPAPRLWVGVPAAIDPDERRLVADARAYLPLFGTTTGNDAPPGAIGEYISQIVPRANAVFLTTSVCADVASITLSPGDWDVCGELWTYNPVEIAIIGLAMSIILGSATQLDEPSDAGAYWALGSTTMGVRAPAYPLGPCRINVTSPTPVYLTATVAFNGVGDMEAYGKLCARRVR
jgi:hypothetical protein